jgi:hypothetical protein
MGFMDKAKKLAEQAQQKLEEVQKDFNKGGAPEGGEGSGQRFDEHGRPVGPDAPQPNAPQPEAPPAGETPAPTAQPAPATPDPTAPPPPAGGSDANASPDPFKPLDK